MTSKSYVVLGEAPESDSEEEIDSSVTIKASVKKSKGKIIGGEAPESDEESCVDTGSLESVSSALSASSLPSLTGEKKSGKKNQSLLTKKLYERNQSLFKNLNEFVSQTAANAASELNATDQQLLKCQVQLQEATDILKILNLNLNNLSINANSLLSISYLPYISVDKISDK